MDKDELETNLYAVMDILNGNDSPTLEMAHPHNVVAQVQVVVDKYNEMLDKIQAVIDSL